MAAGVGSSSGSRAGERAGGGRGGVGGEGGRGSGGEGRSSGRVGPGPVTSSGRVQTGPRAGMTPANMGDYSPYSQPNYDATRQNLLEVGKTVLPGAGVHGVLRGLTTGEWGPQYEGYRGMGTGFTRDGGRPGQTGARPGMPGMMSANQARAQAITGPRVPTMTTPQPWWRTPFPGS